MGPSVVAAGESLIKLGGNLIANPPAFREKIRLQSQRFVNAVPPPNFQAWELTGKSRFGMACKRSILGANTYYRTGNPDLSYRFRLLC
jgi:hypothetical protein